MKALFLLMLAAATAGGPVASGEQARICFVRAEDNGAMNLHPVRLFVGQAETMRQVAELKGGETSCLDVHGGSWSVEARSRRPYDPAASDPDKCRSAVLKANLRKTERVTIRVSPRAERSTYVCAWELVRGG